MGKVVLIAFLGFLGFGGYWFYWEDSGGNAPITVEYEVSVAGIYNRSRGDFKGTLGLYATPDKAKLSLDMDFKMQGQSSISITVEGLIRLDKKKAYLILPEKEIYTQWEFDYVPKSQTKKMDDNDFDWFDVFDVTVEGRWFGEEDESYYARKHLPNKEEMAKMLAKSPGSKAEVWFTSSTKLGSRYVKGLNKMLRIKPEDESDLKLPMKIKDEKRPQFAAKDLPYFPIPLKLYFFARTPQAIKIDLTAKKFSRKRISSSEFKVPSGFKKVSIKKFGEKLLEEVMASAMSGARR